jgi:hypothetical protein
VPTKDRKRSVKQRVRFEVFKRDQFTCQYCGQTPPAVVLEVDHIVARADRGSDEPANLITACFDCNRGKGAVPLSARLSLDDVESRRRLLQERVEQAEAYEQMLKERRYAEDAAIDEIVAVYEAYFDGWTLLEGTRQSIRNFLRKLPKVVVTEAMEMACLRLGYKEKLGRSAVFRYFCGICWRKIKNEE